MTTYNQKTCTHQYCSRMNIGIPWKMYTKCIGTCKKFLTNTRPMFRDFSSFLAFQINNLLKENGSIILYKAVAICRKSLTKKSTSEQHAIVHIGPLTLNKVSRLAFFAEKFGLHVQLRSTVPINWPVAAIISIEFPRHEHGRTIVNSRLL